MIRTAGVKSALAYIYKAITKSKKVYIYSKFHNKKSNYLITGNNQRIIKLMRYEINAS